MNEVVYNTAEAVNSLTNIPEPQLFPYTLVEESDVRLKKKVQTFDFANLDVDPEVIATRLIDTAKYHDSFCVTANQCGLDTSIFVAGSGNNFVAFFNPEILIYSDETSVTAETDLSNMGLLLQVKRPTSITISYEDYTGESKLAQFDGLTGRIVQQCVDRLNGIDFKTKVSKLVLDRATASLNKRIKKFVKHNTYIKR